MRASTMIQLGVMVVLGIPFLGIMAWGYDVTRWIDAVTDASGAEEIADLPEFPRSIFSPLTWIENMEDRRELERLFSPAITTGRTVSFGETYPFASLLAEGEAAPEPELRLLWATARAPGRAIRHCEGIVGTIAQSCDVLETEVRVDGDDVTVSTMLAYVPSFDIGAPSRESGAEVVRGPLIPLAVPAFGDAGSDAAPRGRENLLRMAEEVCTRLRERFGNCVPDHLTLAADRDAALAEGSLTVAVHTAEAIDADDLRALAFPE